MLLYAGGVHILTEGVHILTHGMHILSVGMVFSSKFQVIQELTHPPAVPGKRV